MLGIKQNKLKINNNYLHILIFRNKRKCKYFKNK